MDGWKILSALNDVDDRLKRRADPFAPPRRSKGRVALTVLKGIAGAAACVLLLGVFLFMAQVQKGMEARESAGGVSPAASVPARKLPEITLPEGELPNGELSLSQLFIDEDAPLFHEEITLEQAAAVLGEETFTLAGWSLPEDWYATGRASYEQDGSTRLMMVYGGNTSGYSNNGVTAVFLAADRNRFLREELAAPAMETYDFAGTQVSVRFSTLDREGEELQMTALAELDTGKNLAVGFYGVCRMDSEDQRREMLTAANQFMVQCALHPAAVDLRVLDKGVPFPAPTPDPMKVLTYQAPDTVTIDEAGRLTFDNDDLQAMYDALVPQPVQASGGEVMAVQRDENGTLWECRRTVELALPTLLWTNAGDGPAPGEERRLYRVDRQVYGFFTGGGGASLREISKSSGLMGLLGTDPLWSPGEGDQYDPSVRAFIGCDDSGVLSLLYTYRDEDGYYREKAMRRLAEDYARQAGLDSSPSQPDFSEDPLAEVEGVSIDASGWLYFDDADRQEAYFLLAPGVSVFDTAESPSLSPSLSPSPAPAEDWKPLRESAGIPTEDGTLTLALPVPLWQDGEKPTRKLYALRRNKFTFYDFHGEKSVSAVAGYSGVAGLAWSEADQAWQPWFPGVEDGNLTDELRAFTGMEDPETLLALLRESDRALEGLGEQIQALKNNYCRLSGRDEYLG